MSYINFHPHVGKFYQSKGLNGKRIMVLGDSHYCKDELKNGGRCHPFCSRDKMDEDCVNETIYCVTGHAYEHSIRAYTIFERAFYGRVLNQDERIDFWESIIFYNYIQYAQPGPRRQLDQPEVSKHESELAFKEIIDKYLPDYIIAWGLQENRLYSFMPDWGGEDSVLMLDNGDSRNIWTYKINNKEIPVLFIQHPSSGMSWEYCHLFIKAFLDLPESILNS